MSPLSIKGLRTDSAPSKKTFELLSSGEPENSSIVHGPCAFLAFMPSTRACPCSWPTLKLSKAM